ncbi:tRNA adenosine(34) deaminase TadA [Alteromonas lipotrueiana]|uniref:tRNA adenosine(34) deaminase TadA n=1 Tax=Alteromonas lipotrueiana TaxID=2803815 RepID=UPI001C487F0B|nr:tRNA adenosine(34) deaminase TadA [Alteromonas lipotrueiana]
MNSSNSPTEAVIDHSDEHWMQLAIERARRAEALGEVPVGAIVVLNGKIIGEGWNTPITDHDPSAHAELQAIRMAAKAVQNYRIVDATLYVTLEPCPMCAGAIVHSRLKRVVFGAYDLKTGAAGSALQLLNHSQLNHQPGLCGGILKEACAEVISHFFARRRAEKKALKLAQRAYEAER